MSLFVDIAALEDIPQQGARIIKTPEGCVALFRTADDRVFALDDRCPHKGGPLSEGIVHGTSVTCPLHNWVFDMTTGVAQGADDGAVRTWPVRVEAGRILITTDLIARSRAA
ncbi:nitrite reductase small subunit NirD [Paracoccus sp. R12_1]|jgi:nitrite reductase (NADH) small subunit|uniref:nitrite reductase small subunit NirD n=1 Tax=unclassified Paracoccus (in: a-proteobacteria) TaxID=2688777 RepID=UPI001ADC4EF2|nr:MULTISPECIES: nitrite reductase small subunit NirD [unclassified Paracoccus (in: a-proteobacteria)]MBO9457418.1 nitrite reductase small subunit NirD [Paracoccus sp. R12_2]MBO9488699.1 nitrite reductase small subunit NirD [Paracoccus sp. R12_1]